MGGGEQFQGFRVTSRVLFFSHTVQDTLQVPDGHMFGGGRVVRQKLYEALLTALKKLNDVY